MNLPSGLDQPYDFALRHLSLTLLVVGLVFAFLVLAIMRRHNTARRVVDVFFRSYLFWTIGVFYLYGAITKGALGQAAIDTLHLQAVPASSEAAYADLAFAVIALLAVVLGGVGLRLAAVLGPAIFVLAPIAIAEPATVSTLTAHAPLAAIYGLGIVFFILQLGAGRAPVIRHRSADADILPT